MNITINKEVLEQALDALETVTRWRETGIGRPPEQTSIDAITALREALAQPQPVQEPVGFVVATRWNADGITTRHAASFRDSAVVKAGDLLYTSPAAALTTPEMLNIAAQAMEQSIGGQAACLRAVELTVERFAKGTT